MHENYILCFTLSLILLSVTSPAHAETRCGWFENPTPGNAWLTDADGQWVISTQGTESEVEGDWPSFEGREGGWVHTNGGSYGYGCVCMKVKTDAATETLLKIESSRVLPLSVCRTDKDLTEPEHPDFEQ